MKDRYTNVSLVYNQLAFRGIENGKRVRRIVDYSPSLFVPSPGNKKTKWKAFIPPKNELEPNQQIFVERMRFASIKQTREYMREYSKLNNFELFGSNRFAYTYIADNYKDTSEFALEAGKGLSTAILDIEVGSETGFPKPEEATEPVIAITVYLTDQKKYYVFGCGEYTTTRSDVKYIKAFNEYELLEKFISFWSISMPDILTGWYTSFFDIPYLYNRIHKCLGIDQAKKLSPWGQVTKRNIKIKGVDQEAVDIVGVDGLDYLDLYKKFSGKTDYENNKLNTIAAYELDEKKLDFSEHSSLHKLYLNDYQKFIDYNIKDVELVLRLEEKLQLIRMAVTMAYNSKTNFQDVFAQVTMWDAIIFNYFRQNNLVVPMKDETDSEDFEGAFVKPPIPALYKWVVSYDLDSLYPNLIIQFNISPDTVIQRNGNIQSFNVHNKESIYNLDVDSDFLKEKQMTVCGNGQLFTTEKQGFLPSIIEPMYIKRKQAKEEQIRNEHLLEEIDKEINLRKGI